MREYELSYHTYTRINTNVKNVVNGLKLHMNWSVTWRCNIRYEANSWMLW